VRVAELMRRLDSRVLPPLAEAIARIAQGPGRGRVLTAVALLSATAVLVTAVWAAQRPSGGLDAGAVVAVGVRPGDSAGSYEEQARAELAQMRAAASSSEPPYALVSFGAYLAPDRLPEVLAGATVSQVFARVPLPDMRTQIVRIPAQRVPEDVVAGMELFAERKDREAVGFQEKANQTYDEQERRGYEESARTALAEATAYRLGCSCVYAAVVRAAPEQLGALAERPGVRTVDPAPEVDRLDRAIFHPPLPEQLGDARPFGTPSAPAPNGTGAPPPSAPAGDPTPPPSPAPVGTAATGEPTPAPPSAGPEPSAVEPSPSAG
jgi:hypothetical protein